MALERLAQPRPALVRSMKGLGDNIYQRALVRRLAAGQPVYLTTPWPELYADIEGIRFVREETRLRTQAKNLRRQPGARWSRAPAGCRQIRVSYAAAGFDRIGILAAMERQLGGAGPLSFDLPPAPAWPGDDGRPLALVRPVTERREWASAARAPLPEYVAEAAEILMQTHHVISVADVDGVNEWFVGEPPPAHECYHAGELAIERLLSLVRSADVVVGGVGWIVPAAIAARVRLYCILGGRGGHNAPAVITDPRMDLSRVGWATPDRFCGCSLPAHACDKRISNFVEGFRTWLARPAT